jgi:hypothetical protein
MRLTVLSMEVSDLEGIFAPFYDVVVSFIEIGRRREFWSGKLRNGTQIESVYSKPDKVEAEDSEKLDGEDDLTLVENRV